jgi:hypothetical protein
MLLGGGDGGGVSCPQQPQDSEDMKSKSHKSSSTGSAASKPCCQMTDMKKGIEKSWVCKKSHIFVQGTE